MEINGNWQIIKDDLTSLLGLRDENISDLLVEDMFQATNSDWVIDSGWYEDRFISYLIFGYDWDNPVVRIISYSVNEALAAINAIVLYFGSVSKV